MIRFALLVLLLAACDKDPVRDQNQPQHEPPRPRRVIEPPVGNVRPLPPHLISTSGVGPYHLGDRMSDLMQQLPSGPRMAVFEIKDLLHRSLLRAEEGDSVLIGGEPGSVASFVSVLDEQVARTESGLHVGSTRADVAKLGPTVTDLDHARDRRLVQQRGLRFLFDSERDDAHVVAIVVATDTAAKDKPVHDASECQRPAPSDVAFGACLSSAGELVTVTAGEVSVRAPDSDKILAHTLLLSNVQFVVPLRTEGRDELVVVRRTDDGQTRTWSAYALKLDGTKLVVSIEPQTLYSVSAANARWIGAELKDVDLVLELTSTRDAIEVGGLLTTRADPPAPQTPLRDVVVISPAPPMKRHGKSASQEGSGAEGSDASAPNGDAGGAGSGSGARPGSNGASALQ
ncbi:MAG TPA: hypothetical protein VGM90_09590 [Kofleriaceae bacterium]